MKRTLFLFALIAPLLGCGGERPDNASLDSGSWVRLKMTGERGMVHDHINYPNETIYIVRFPNRDGSWHQERFSRGELLKEDE